MLKDPLEMHDIAGQQPEVVTRMRTGYEVWFKDIAIEVLTAKGR